MAQHRMNIEILGKRLQLLEMKVEELKPLEAETISERLTFIESRIFAGKQMLTTEEAAYYIGISRSLLYKMTHTMQIPHYKPRGKMVYFDKDELDDWMRQGKVDYDCSKSNEQEDYEQKQE